MDLIFIGLILVVIGTGIFIVHKKIIRKLQDEYKERGVISTPNSKGQHIQLIRVNGCGMSFAGTFRTAIIGGAETYVTYYTFYLIFIPLIPFKAYRVIRNKGVYNILGTENGSLKERILILVNIVKWLSGCTGIILLILGFLDYFNL